ncbi:MAG TPA: hypothetical protein VJZ01_00145 [Lachnospiraceae bacterium]|nr:hypothetical protein [Lachnospiraceae bacterium]
MQSIENASAEQLAQIKLWLFQENIRIENEKEELLKKQKEFNQEKAIVLRQIKEQENRYQLEEKQLSLEKSLFKQKWEILENAYRDLHEEQQKFELEKQQIIGNHKREQSQYIGAQAAKAGLFFRGVDNSLALKKRYKDLIKIFHPDNVAGDNDTVQLINREYSNLRDVYQT